MSQTIFAIKGRLGSTDYWAVTMKASEVVRQIRIPKEVEGWDDLSIEEKYQRDININRIKKDIAPYMAEDPNRFFGALLVAVQNGDEIRFEDLENVLAKSVSIPNIIPSAYRLPAKEIGFLTLPGEVTMFPIDGQHRLKALKYAIDGIDDSGKPLGFEGNQELAKDDVVVILIKFEPKKARYIFSKVNRYAKPTTKGQNLITDDDDPYAIITRRIANKLLPQRLINLRTNTLSDKAPEFTTLSTLYECVKFIIDSHPKLAKKPSAPQIKVAEGEVEKTLKHLFDKIDHFNILLHDEGESGDKKRCEMRKGSTGSLLAKPVGQQCLVRAYVTLKNRKPPVAPEEIVDKLNKINWGLEGSHWQGIIMNGSRILTNGPAIKLATDFIIHYMGYMNDEEQEQLLERFKSLRTSEEAKNITALPTME